MPCTSPQTTFGNIAQGDANPMFTSSVGVRTADQFLIFSGYSGPVPSNFDGGAPTDAGADAAVPNGYLIYVQAFDPVTGNKTGAAAPAFQAPDGTGAFYVLDVSIAPTGEIVLLHCNSNGDGYGRCARLYASFLSPTVAGAAVKVVRTVLLESLVLGDVHATWSVPSQAFVFSWKYETTAWFLRIRKFLVAGTPAGGDTAVVPTVSGSQNDQTIEEGSVGASGSMFGVVSRNSSSGSPFLTVLDGDGLQVGGFTELSTVNYNPWATIAGTANGFVSFYVSGACYETFVPIGTDGGVALPDAGDAGMAPLPGFSYPCTASFGKALSDDTGGNGGVGLVQLEAGGASFVYVKANGTSNLQIGTVISSASGSQVAITNYHGSFGISLFDGKAHSTQMIASGCK